MDFGIFRSGHFTRAQVDLIRTLATQTIGESRVAKVADLGTPTLGRRAIVTDATSTAFHSIVAGGGVNTVPVFADGASWRIG